MTACIMPPSAQKDFLSERLLLNPMQVVVVIVITSYKCNYTCKVFYGYCMYHSYIVAIRRKNNTTLESSLISNIINYYKLYLKVQ